MSGLTLPVLVTVMAGLLALVPVSAAIGPRLALIGTAILAALGTATILVHLLAGAPPTTLTLPVGLAGQSTILALDGLSALFTLIVLAVAAMAALAACDDAHPWPTAPALPGFAAGMLLCLLASDAFALVAGFELMSVASFVLVATHHTEEGVQSAARLYAGMAALSGLCLIAALALLAPNGASFAAMRTGGVEPWRATLVLALALLGPGAKAGLVPLHVWLPPAHAAAPAPVSALMSAAMTKVALYVLIRLVFDLAGSGNPLWWGLPLIALGIAGAVLGALRANMEMDIKTILACSTVENIGLITLGLGLALAARGADLAPLARLAAGAALLHSLAHAGFKSLLFLGAGAVLHQAGSRALAKLGGLAKAMPITVACLLLAAASLAGLPPSAGFAGEWLLFQSVIGAVRLGGIGLQVMACVVAAMLALATALAASAALRLAGVALLGRPRSAAAAAATDPGPALRWAMLLPALAVTLIGLAPGLVLALAQPALAVMLRTAPDDTLSILALQAGDHAQLYAPLLIAALLAAFLVLITQLLRRHAVQGARGGPLWDCGYGDPPAWQPFGDPAAQYGGASFAQPLRRVLGPLLLDLRETIHTPPPGDISVARLHTAISDPAQRLVFTPLGQWREAISRLADRLHFLTVRQILTMMGALLALLLAYIAAMEQL